MRIHCGMTGRAAAGRNRTLALLLLAGVLLGGAGSAHAETGAVFTTTNSATDNNVVMFQSADDGSLTQLGQFSTGGLGTGASLGNAGAVVLSPNKKLLFTINAGSNDISEFAVNANGLTLLQRISSGGTTPVSLTVFGKWLYVVNAGQPSNITGFKIGEKGHLTPIPNSTQGLSQALVKPGQIKFSPYGNLLVVTEQTTNTIDVFPVDTEGVADAAIFSASEGITPFGFDFDPAGHLLISEAATSSASSYFVSTFGILPISKAVENGQLAACWLVSSTDGRFAWTANAASDNISAYSIAASGQINLIASNAGVAVRLTAGSHPTDEAVDGHGHLYVLDGNPGSVTALGINHDGTLTLINTVGSFGGGMTGIAAK
ncbi:MAG TPA: beta-propeller fold lactonase family protein [Chthonomonadaceae bacterium]|nr:beta-propeller fold lactonase family protein [Chthonomonadaceae bacterium]